MTEISLASDAPTSSPAHAWRWALYGRYMPTAPRGVKHKVIGSGFVAFLGLIGQAADPDGMNRKPPGAEYVADACRISRDSVARYWKAAEALGVITVERSPTGRYVNRYSLVTVPEWMLDWPACEAQLSGYKYLADARESRRQDSPPTQSESRRHDSPETAPQGASPDVRQGRVLTSGKASPDVMLRPGDDHAPDHATAPVVDQAEVRAGAREEQPGIPVVEERIVPVAVSRRPLIDRMRRRTDEEIHRLALFGRGAELTAWERARYAEMQATPYSPWAKGREHEESGTVGS